MTKRLVAKIMWFGEFRVVFEMANGDAKFVTYRRTYNTQTGKQETHKIGEGRVLTDQLALVANEINNGR